MVRDWCFLYDDELVARYEAVRCTPDDPERRSLLRAIEVRASRNGRVENLHQDIRVAYIWAPGQETVNRYVLTEMGARQRRRDLDDAKRELAQNTRATKLKQHQLLLQIA